MARADGKNKVKLDIPIGKLNDLVPHKLIKSGELLESVNSVVGVYHIQLRGLSGNSTPCESRRSVTICDVIRG